MKYNTDIIKQDGKNVIVTAPCFSLSQTLDCGQAFRFAEVDGIWQGVVGDRLLKMEQTDGGVLFYDITADEFCEKYYDYFTLGFDYAELQHELCADETLKKAIEFAGGIRLLKQDKWETLCSFIISQNNNIPRIKGIISRLCKSFGEKIDGSDEYTFPDAEKIAALSLDDLAPLRSGFRAKYILDAAQKVANGEIDYTLLETAPLDEARAELMKIKGVGPKVAECALLFSCGRFDAFPLDVWMKRVMAVLYPNGLPQCAVQYKGIAQQYLFHYSRCIKLSDNDETAI